MFCLLKALNEASAAGGCLRLAAAPGGQLRRILVLLEVDHLLPVYDSIDEASQPLAGPQHPLLKVIRPR